MGLSEDYLPEAMVSGSRMGTCSHQNQLDLILKKKKTVGKTASVFLPGLRRIVDASLELLTAVLTRPAQPDGRWRSGSGSEAAGRELSSSDDSK